LMSTGGNGREQLSYSADGVPEEWQWYPGKDAYQQTHLDNRLGFAGYVWDPWLKVYHVRHRVYHPFDTRWLQADPIGYAGGDTDLRRYCNGDPVNFVDPLGLCGGAGGTDESWMNRGKSIAQFSLTPQQNQAIDRALEDTGAVALGVSRLCGAAAAVPLTGGASLAGYAGAAVLVDQMVTGATEIVTAEPQQSQVNKLGEAAAKGLGADPGTARSVGDAVEITAVLGPVLNNIARNIANRLLGTGGANAAGAGAAASGEAQAGKAGKTAAGEGSPAAEGTAASKGGSAGGTPTELPDEFARVVPAGKDYPTLGPAGAADCFVTPASEIAGLNAAQISAKLTIKPSATGYDIYILKNPSGLASPINRTDPGWLPGGSTGGGAREYVIPNQPTPPGGPTRTVR